MSDLQVSSDVDLFVQSADTPAMRANLGMGFEYQTQAAPVVCTATYQDLINWNLGTVDDGTYQITASIQWLYTSNTKSAFFRVNVNSEGWQEFTRLTDVEQIVSIVGKPRVFASQSVTVQLQARKEDSSGTMTVGESFLTLERKI